MLKAELNTVKIYCINMLDSTFYNNINSRGSVLEVMFEYHESKIVKTYNVTIH